MRAKRSQHSIQPMAVCRTPSADFLFRAKFTLGKRITAFGHRHSALGWCPTQEPQRASVRFGKSNRAQTGR